MNRPVENGENLSENIGVKKVNKCVFILQSLVHLVFTIYYLCLLAYGGYICYTGILSEKDILRFMSTFAFGFGTNWNVAFQTIFLLLALTHDSLQWLSKEQSSLAKKIGHWRDVVFNALVVPYTLFVSIMFWCLYTIDRDLVFPQVYDDIVPWWFNHCVHTNIAIVVAVETLLTARRQPASRKVELMLNSVVAFGYAIVYYTIYYFTGRWLYNIFGIMTWWQVCLYQLLIWSSTYLFYFIHFPINRIFHGQNEEDLIEEKTEPVEGFDNPVKSDSFAAEVWSQNVYIRDNVENSRL